MKLKLLMENWRKFLKEGITDIVWHKTEEYKFMEVLKDDRFMLSGAFSKPSEERLSKGKLYYFSTARTPNSSYFPGRRMNGVIIKLDGRKLAENLKGTPTDYNAISYMGSDGKRVDKSSKKSSRLGRDSEIYGTPDESFEAEDRILSDKPYIDNATDYMLEVHLAVPVYTGKTTNYDKGTYKVVAEKTINPAVYHRLKQITAMLKERGIPTFLHITPDTWKSVAISKTKALTDWNEVEQAIDEAGITIGDKPEDSDYEGSPMGQGEVDTFVEMASQILSGNKELDRSKIKGDIGYLKEKDRYYKADYHWRSLGRGGEQAIRSVANDMENPLHNLSAEPKGRQSLDSLASLMRQTKKKTITDFVTYLQSVLLKNNSQGNQ